MWHARCSPRNIGWPRRDELGLVQENSTKVTYTGTWARVALSGASAGYVKHASTATAKASHSFTGRGVAVAMTMGPDRGKVGIYVDGALARTIDLYSATTKLRQVVFAAKLTAGSHTVELRVLGQKNAASTGKRVDLDAIIVTR